MMQNQETTEFTLFVRTTGEDIARWNRQRIVDALMREAHVDVETAEEISRQVERQIVSSGISLLTTSLIRELVDAKLIERGLEQARRLHARLGFPLYDVRQLIMHQNKENANVPHGPEGTNLVLAEGIKREFALHDVFSREVVDAHVAGDIHLHGLGYIDRPYSSIQPLEYIKRFGLNIPQFVTVAKPAKHAEVLLAHMVRFGAILQGHFAGMTEWDAVNVFFAPYLVGLTDREVKQIAQMLIYEFSQLTSARGGQAIFTDVHLYWHMPAHLSQVPAIGPAGDYTGKAYGDYLPEAQRFAWALFEVFQKGDGAGKPFIFPRPLVHISREFFRQAGHEAFLRHVCQVAADKGNPCFHFDRDPSPADVWSRWGAGGATPPWKMRAAVLQNVTLNLPRLGYLAKRDDGALFGLISERLDLVAKAHRQKLDFFGRLMDLGPDGPLAMLAMDRDGEPYLRIDALSALVGVVGLSELVRIHRGAPLQDTDGALSFGLEVIRYMGEELGRLGRQYGLRMVLEQTHAETTAYRFARLDLRYFSPEAGHFVQGNLVRGEVYYTNSTHLPVSASVDPRRRVRIEGAFHPLMGGGVITHIWLDEVSPAPEDLASFIGDILRHSENRQVVFSPEFTLCGSCGATSRGLKEVCPSCGSGDTDGLARITQYYSRTSGWNRGKLAELRDRKRWTTIPPQDKP